MKQPLNSRLEQVTLFGTRVFSAFPSIYKTQASVSSGAVLATHLFVKSDIWFERVTRKTKKNHTFPLTLCIPKSRVSKSGILSLSSFCPGQNNHWINFIPKSLYLASTATTLKVEQSVLLPLVKKHLHIEGDLWQNKQPHFPQIYICHSLSGRKLCLFAPSCWAQAQDTATLLLHVCPYFSQGQFLEFVSLFL